MTGQCHPDRLNFSGRGNLDTCPQCNGSQVLVKWKQRRHPEACPRLSGSIKIGVSEE